MAYASVQDVRDRAPQIEITATSKPTEATVEEWLTDLHVTLDAALDTMGYLVPITGPASILILRDMVVQKMIGLVLRSRIYGIGDVNQTGAAEADKYYESRLTWLRDRNNPFVLPDAEVDGEVAEGLRGAYNFGFIADEDLAHQGPRVWMGKRF